VSSIISRFVQTLIAKLPVEAFDVGVLDRLAGSNETPFEAALIRSHIERPAGKFRSVVAHQDLREPDRFREAFEDADDTGAGQRATWTVAGSENAPSRRYLFTGVTPDQRSGDEDQARPSVGNRCLRFRAARRDERRITPR
jgi:hypothetical protein